MVIGVTGKVNPRAAVAGSLGGFCRSRAPNPLSFTLAFEGHDVRTVTVDGDVWFVLADVCRVLDIANPSMAKARLEQADLSTTEVRSNGQNRAVTIVNESGLYDVVLDSRKPNAKRFRRWITTEVVPSIRKTGGYAQPGYTVPTTPAAPVADPALIGQAVADAVTRSMSPLIARIERLESGVEVAAGGRTPHHRRAYLSTNKGRNTKGVIRCAVSHTI